MAVQPHKKAPGLQVLRTPAPDELTQIRSPRGGTGYGQNAPQASSIPPGQGGPQTLLGQNMRQSVDDPVADMVIAKGIAGRGDNIPADQDDQLRPVSADPFPSTHGATRQQDPSKVFGKASLPASTSSDEGEPVRQP